MKTFDIFELNDKRRLYWLIDLYISNRINIDTFCDQYYYTYSLGEIDFSSYDEQEKQAFTELGVIVNHYSEFEEDHINHPSFFYTKSQLDRKILEVKEVLAFQYEKVMTEAFIITSINAG